MKPSGRWTSEMARPTVRRLMHISRAFEHI
jgi:hypothetical protein